METQLTPAPWYPGNLVLNAHMVYSADEKTVVVICRNHVDANVIAAAPDMFHALHQCIEALDAVNTELSTTIEGGMDRFTDVLRTSLAALKKAQGEA